MSKFGGLPKVPKEVVLPTQACVRVRHAILDDNDDFFNLSKSFNETTFSLPFKGMFMDLHTQTRVLDNHASQRRPDTARTDLELRTNAKIFDTPYRSMSCQTRVGVS